MGSNMVDLAILLGLGIGGYYLISSGYLNNLMGVYAPNLQQMAQKGKEKEDDDDDNDNDVSLEGDMIGGGQPQQQYQEQPPPGFDQQQFIPGGYPYEQQPQQYQQPPPQQFTYQQSPPPPGAVSSLYPVNVPSGPPYVSQTVGTYSQYSPYNQFNVYRETQTQPFGQFYTTPDDNVGFTDIRTDSYSCRSCKDSCRRHRYGFTCRSCRMPCKKIGHSYIPAQRGWDIGPVGTLPAGQLVPQQPLQQYSPYGYGGGGGYLGMVADWLGGFSQKGDVFTDMDDYHQGRRFDCHNKLKRRARGKDNSFVTQQDYYYDRNDVGIALA